MYSREDITRQLNRMQGSTPLLKVAVLSLPEEMRPELIRRLKYEIQEPQEQKVEYRYR